MNKPARQGVYADRHIDYQFAMEDQFLELMEAARSAGWSVEDAATAITSLADNLVLEHQATEHLEGVIARLKAGKS